MRLRVPVALAAAGLLTLRRRVRRGLRGPGGRGSGGQLSGTLTVVAAASLTDVVADLDDQLMAEDPDLRVTSNTAGSSALATQVTQGSPADVTGIADVGNADPTLAVCAPGVPCGAAAETVFEAAGVTARPDTLEEDVRAALTEVELGEVDAALVYASDVQASDVQAAGDRVEGIEGIAFRAAEDAVNAYPIAALADAPDPDAARAIVDLVRSDAGRQALTDAGFGTPAT